MYLHDNEADNYAICNEYEKKELLNRKEMVRFMNDDSYVNDIMQDIRTRLAKTYDQKT